MSNNNEISDLDVEIEARRLAFEVSKQFRRQMDIAGLKPTDVANRIGVTKARVSRVLRGDANVTLHTFAQFGLACDILWTFAPVRYARNYWATRTVSHGTLQYPIVRHEESPSHEEETASCPTNHTPLAA